MTAKLVGAAAAAALALFFTGPAHALLSRAWVSGKGTDAPGCGAAATPCRSFQFVHDTIIAAGGEIDVLDPAGYGALSITKSLSIVNDGAGLAGVQRTTSGAAIAINAGGTGKVHLRGLTVDGLGVANGIEIFATGSVELVDCVVRNSARHGIHLLHTAVRVKLLLDNVVVSNGRGAGILIEPAFGGATVGLVKRTRFENNLGAGLHMNSPLANNPQVPSGRLDMTVVDSTASGNGDSGFAVSALDGASNVSLLLDRVVSVNNTISGLRLSGFAAARITRSTFTRNSRGVLVEATATAESLGDNVIRGNTIQVEGVLTQIAPK